MEFIFQIGGDGLLYLTVKKEDHIIDKTIYTK